MRNNVPELLARRARRLDRKRISLKSAAREMDISYYTLNAIVNNTIREYPVTVLKALCDYFECNIGDEELLYHLYLLVGLAWASRDWGVSERRPRADRGSPRRSPRSDGGSSRSSRCPPG